MIVVTGGAGFIGSTVVARLNAEKLRDLIIVDHLDRSSKWQNLVGKEFRAYINKDEFLARLESGEWAGGISAIIHLGACSSTTENDVDYLMKNNLEYSQRLARYAAEADVRFVYASSAATYGNGEEGYSDFEGDLLRLKPLNPYGFSKHLFDLWAEREGVLKANVGLKFFNVYGPNEYHKLNQMSMVRKAHQQIKAHGTVRLFKSAHPDYKDGEQRRDFIYVKDCADVIWWILQTRVVSGLFNLGTGSSRTWNDLATSVYAALGLQPQIEYVDLPIELRDHYQYFTEAKMQKLSAAGYTKPFHSLEAGVKDYVVNHLEKSWPFL